MLITETTLVVVLPLMVLFQTDMRQNKSKGKNLGQTEAVTFQHSIAPVLKKNCSPCHFEGGKIFDTYPFDRYETARTLGNRLNTRLKGDDAELVDRWIKEGMAEIAADSTRK
jgi:hypothetical protein